eukprot:2579191-Rhodomonas_salina.2
MASSLLLIAKTRARTSSVLAVMAYISIVTYVPGLTRYDVRWGSGKGAAECGGWADVCVMLCATGGRMKKDTGPR